MLTNRFSAVFGVCLSLLIYGVSLSGKDTDAPKEESSLLKNWQELKKRNLDLVPVPKNISFDGREIVISGSGEKEIAVVLPQKTERGMIAASEIISRIKELAPGKEIPVLSEARKGAFNIFIENTWPNTLTSDKNRPEDVKKTGQAYSIYLLPDGMKLSGEGEMGMLYAAVTTRFLIAKKGNKVILYPASVFDWPDFKYRFAASFPPYFSTGHMKKTDYFDWLFRLKLNGVFRHTIGSVSQSSIPGEINPKDENIIQEEAGMNDYALLRGIGNMQGEKVSLGKYPADMDRPGFDKMLFNKNNKCYFCWSRHDLHEIKAKNLADFCTATRTRFVFVHAVDGGSYSSPEHWDKRCSLCREKYGDDRASADADMFNIYADALKKYSKNSEMLAVAYPYVAGIFDNERVMKSIVSRGGETGVEEKALEIRRKLQDWMKDLNQKLRPELRICVREDSRKYLLQFYEGFRERPFYIYWGVAGDRSLQPVLPTTLRCLNAAYAPERKRAAEDIMWVNDNAYYGLMFVEAIRVCLSEYSWNTRFPGYSDDYKSSCEPKFLEIDDQKALDIMAERAAVGFFGSSAAEYAKELYRHYLSFKLAANPRDTIIELRLSPQEALTLLKRNKMAAGKASTALNMLWENIKNSKKHNENLINNFAYPLFIEMLRVVNAAKVYSDVNLGEFEAMEYIKNGNAANALNIVKETETLLTGGKKEYDRIMEETKDEPCLRNYDKIKEKLFKHRGGTELLNPDYKSLESRLANLRENYLGIYAKYNISEDFRKWFASREITAYKMKSATAPDGYPDENAWKNVSPLEYFANNNFILCPEPLFLRFLYDDKCLYIDGKVFSSGNASSEDSINIFIACENKAEPVVYKLSVNAKGVFTSGMKKNLAEDVSFQNWQSGGKSAVKKEKDGWTFKIAVPFEKLNLARSHEKTFCKVDYIRKSEDKNTDPEIYSSSIDGEKKSNPLDSYSKFSFASGECDISKPSITIECNENKMKISTEVHSTGVGSLVTFSFGVKTDRILRNVVMNGFITDEKGGVLAEIKNIERNLVQTLWTDNEPCQIQLENMHDVVKIQLHLDTSTLDGEKIERTETFKLGHEKPNPENSLALPKIWKCVPDPKEEGRGKSWFAPGFNDRSWKNVSILRSLESQGIKDYTYAWYRTSVPVPEKYKDKKVYLMLGAVDDTCWVWINGKTAGEYLYDPVNNPDSWRKPLFFNISSLLTFGENNQITVLVRKKNGQHGGIWSASYLLFED